MPKQPGIARRRRRTADEQIADLEAQIEELRAKAKQSRKFSAEEVLAERERLELSAASYAELVGVSPLTIYSWEKGRTKPRPGQLERLLSLKGIAKEKAWDELGIESGFSPEAVATERERLELSAADYAELIGVSALTIYNWEHGRTRPRAKQLEKWLSIQGIGKRKAWKQLGYA